METQEVQIRVENVYKIFGSNPPRALRMLNDGMDKATIHEKTGMTVGVTDATFEIYRGEILSSWVSQAQVSRPWCACLTA